MDESWSRSDQKRKNRVQEESLARLTDELVRVAETRLAELDLPEDCLDAILEAQRIKSPPARNRQLRRIRALLRDADASAIRARLTALRERGSANATLGESETNRRTASWTLRLLGEGPVGLEAFLEEFPQADRTHLRQLVRNVERATHERRVKAEERLAAALRGFLR
jgi:ribosome-associated protein